jgi:hypothetical protein
VLGNLFLINIRVSPTHFPRKRCSRVGLGIFSN